mmetsp:Transcript_20373/g.60071  ORF Transcript_20373/g.60071 Transcript_20373/m.60071 type:complete len:85 (+) Transcript_20373:342-596(+)
MSTMRHFVLKAEARRLYREVLRALKGVEPDTAAGVREAARERFADHANETDVERIRILLVDGHHSLKQMRSLLGGSHDTLRRRR